MNIYSIYKKGCAAGALPIENCLSLDSARRSIKARNGEFFIVVRYIRTEYGYSPETISEQLEPVVKSGRNIYENVKPYKISEV